MNLINRTATGRRHFTQIRRDDRGVVALEFALVAAPLVTLVAGIMYGGLNLTAMSALDNGARNAAHHLRVAKVPDPDDANVRSIICGFVRPFTNCASMQIYVQNAASFAALPPPSIATLSSSFNPGGSGSYVFMSVVIKTNLPVTIAGVAAPVFSSTIVFRNE